VRIKMANVGVERLLKIPAEPSPELRIPDAAAQTRVVSMAGIRLGSWESARAFKGIICDDISEFESHMPSQAVGSLWGATCRKSNRLIRSIGGVAAVVCSRTRAAALPTDRPICNARVPPAIGQPFDWLVPAEAEVFGARLADRPAAFLLA
jgi:hypothetical protein